MPFCHDESSIIVMTNNDNEIAPEKLQSQLSHTKGELTKHQNLNKALLEAMSLSLSGLDLNIPVSPYVTVVVKIPTAALSPAEWQTFDRVMAAMRTGVTKEVDRSELVSLLDSQREKK